MQIIFIHSHKFRQIKSELYSLGGLSNKVLERYTRYCDKLIIIARIKKENETKSTYSKIDETKVKIYDINQIKIKGMKEHIKNSDIAIVRLPCIIGNIAIRYIRKYKKRYLIEVVGCSWDSLWNHGIKGKILAPIMKFITKRDIKRAPYAIYVTNKFLQKRYPTKGIYTGCSDVELKTIDEKILQQRLSKIAEKKYNKKQIVVGTIAAVNVKYKGQKYVIKAIKNLKKAGYNITYRIVGSGKKDFLEKYARKYQVLDLIKFEGSLEHDKIFEFLDDIDIYIQPSNQEGLCRALIEAMSRACPCIASSAGGNPELIDTKYIFKKKDVNDLQNKIKQLVNEKELKMEANKNFKNAKKYSKDNLDDLRNKFYDNLISSLKTGV